MSTFNQSNILVVEHFYGPYNDKSLSIKVNAIQEIKEECLLRMEVQVFIGECVFYRIWIPTIGSN